MFPVDMRSFRSLGLLVLGMATLLLPSVTDAARSKGRKAQPSGVASARRMCKVTASDIYGRFNVSFRFQVNLDPSGCSSAECKVAVFRSMMLPKLFVAQQGGANGKTCFCSLKLPTGAPQLLGAFKMHSGACTPLSCWTSVSRLLDATYEIVKPAKVAESPTITDDRHRETSTTVEHTRITKTVEYTSTRALASAVENEDPNLGKVVHLCENEHQNVQSPGVLLQAEQLAHTLKQEEGPDSAGGSNSSGRSTCFVCGDCLSGISWSGTNSLCPKRDQKTVLSFTAPDECQKGQQRIDGKACVKRCQDIIVLMESYWKQRAEARRIQEARIKPAVTVVHHRVVTTESVSRTVFKKHHSSMQSASNAGLKKAYTGAQGASEGIIDRASRGEDITGRGTSGQRGRGISGQQGGTLSWGAECVDAGGEDLPQVDIPDFKTKISEQLDACHDNMEEEAAEEGDDVKEQFYGLLGEVEEAPTVPQEEVESSEEDDSE